MPITPKQTYLQSLSLFKQRIEELKNQASACYVLAVQDLVNKYQVELATGQMSDAWQVKVKRSERFQTEHAMATNQRKPHRIFEDLKALDAVAIEMGIGPTNMEYYAPEFKK